MGCAASAAVEKAAASAQVHDNKSASPEDADGISSTSETGTSSESAVDSPFAAESSGASTPIAATSAAKHVSLVYLFAETGPLLGSGSFGEVLLAWRLPPIIVGEGASAWHARARLGTPLAAKRIRLTPLLSATKRKMLAKGRSKVAPHIAAGEIEGPRRERAPATAEADILLYLNQRPETARHVVKVIDTFVDSLHLYIFMEYYPRGDMMRMIKNIAPIANLKEVAIIFKKMAVAVQACHDAGVVHRDLKPSNFLIEFDGHEIHLRLCDFGLAQRMPDEDVDILVTGSAGSPVFMSPEVFSQAPYSAVSSDVWALGVSLHILVFGSIPFGASAESSSDIVAAIQNDAAWQPSWTGLPQGLQELLSGLFHKDPRSRMTLPQAISHWWLNDASMGYINNLPSIPEVA